MWLLEAREGREAKRRERKGRDKCRGSVAIPCVGVRPGGVEAPPSVTSPGTLCPGRLKRVQGDLNAWIMPFLRDGLVLMPLGVTGGGGEGGRQRSEDVKVTGLPSQSLVYSL